MSEIRSSTKWARLVAAARRRHAGVQGRPQAKVRPPPGEDESHAINYVVDRKKDMIISSGENVYSVEVENVLSTHPNVLECAVIGIPSKEWGEAVHAVVMTGDKKELSTDEVIAYFRSKIAGYKIPKSVSCSVQSLPKTGPGKIAKRQNRDAFWQGHATKI